jgi:hypothetical protein
MRNLVAWLLSLLAFAFVHEGGHAVTAHLYGEFQAFHFRPFGLEVTYHTPVTERLGFRWAIISGAGNALTILLGYALLRARLRLASNSAALSRSLGFWLTVVLMLGDPINLGVGPFLYRGDALGLAAGLEVSPYAVQAVSLMILLLNCELLMRRVFPAYRVQTRHILFRPLLSVRKEPR